MQQYNKYKMPPAYQGMFDDVGGVEGKTNWTMWGIIIAVIVVILIVVGALVWYFLIRESESFGTTGNKYEQSQLQAYFANFSVSPDILTPITSIDGLMQDNYGTFKFGNGQYSNTKFYVFFKNGRPLKDKDGFIIMFPKNQHEFYTQQGAYGSALDWLRSDYSGDKYDVFKQTCKADTADPTFERSRSGAVSGREDVWGWMTQQAKSKESFTPPTEDKLTKVMMGISN